MKYLGKRFSSLLLLFVLLAPSFAVDQSTFGDTPNLEDQIAEEQRSFLASVTDPVASSIGAIFSPLTSSMSAFFVKINENVDYFITLINLILIVSLLIVSQILIVNIWRFLIKFIIKATMFYRLLLTPTTQVPDVIEMIHNGTIEISKNVRKRLASYNKRDALLLKLSTIAKNL